LSDLEHPNIIKIYDFSGVNLEDLWIVTEILNGETLAEFCRKQPRHRVHPILAAIIIVEISRALEVAHNQGIVHRDVKPENIMVTDVGRIKLMDFGIAKDVHHSSLTVTGTFMGSPSYMSPEQIKGQHTDHRSDLYSLCVLFYEIVTGTLPFTGASTPDVINKIALGSFQAPNKAMPALPKALNDIIVKGMQMDPARRFKGVREIIAGLNYFLNSHDFVEAHVEFERYFANPTAFKKRLREFDQRTKAPPRQATVASAGQTVPPTLIVRQPTQMSSTRVIHDPKNNVTYVSTQMPPQALPPPSIMRGNSPTRIQVRTRRRGRHTGWSDPRPSKLRGTIGVGLVAMFILQLAYGTYSLLKRIPHDESEIKEVQTQTTPVTEEKVVHQERPEPPPFPDLKQAQQPAEPNHKVAPSKAPKPTWLEPRASEPKPTPSEPKPTPSDSRNRPVAVVRPQVAPAPTTTVKQESTAPEVAMVAKLFIISSPAAEILVDQRSMGVSNDPQIMTSGIEIKPGSRLIELRRAGYQPYRYKMYLKAGETKKLKMSLSPLPAYGKLIIRSGKSPLVVTVTPMDGGKSRRYGVPSTGLQIDLMKGIYKVKIDYLNQTITRTVNIKNNNHQLVFNADFEDE
jgi:serine/threonine protein kinase